MTDSYMVSGLPFPLAPSQPWSWTVNEDSISTFAKARTDVFIDPSTGGVPPFDSKLDAVMLLGQPPEGDFTLEARVTVDFKDTFDAGVLILWVDQSHWAKLCFEYSPDRHPMIVSVVCRGVADDANSFVVDGNDVWLRVARKGRAFALHASLDGKRWELIRTFMLDGADSALKVAFEAQSPMGEGCDVAFRNIAYRERTIEDLRDGS